VIEGYTFLKHSVHLMVHGHLLILLSVFAMPSLVKSKWFP